MGSQKLVFRGPRIIDLDVLFYGDAVVHEEGIEVPHPRLSERRFVLVPLADIAPELQHPVSHETMLELLSATKDRSTVRAYAGKNESTKK
jgi:2-amino-4-hydroxy-6-hydroxymethyldihydropteridine diphosphokinase